MLIIYDTETTGVGSDARIVELASVVLHEGKLTEFVERCNPEVPIPAGASRVHGIYDQDVADCRTATEVVSDWMGMLIEQANSSDVPPVMAGHNQQFDARMLKAYQKIPFPLTLCSLKLARKYSVGFENHKLETVYKSLGLTGIHQAHSALDDVRMTTEIIFAYCNQLGKGYVDIAQEQCKPQTLAVMPFGKHKGSKMSDVPKSYITYMLGLEDLDRDVRHTFEGLVG